MHHERRRFEAPDGFRDAVFESFGRQGAMRHLHAEIQALEPGYCEIGVDYRSELSQQNGFFHAGVTSAVADSSGGYAAFSLFAMPSDVLTVEFKISLLEPARGQSLVACGEVLRSGRRLTTCTAHVYVIDAGRRTLCAIMLQTVAKIAPAPA